VTEDLRGPGDVRDWLAANVYGPRDSDPVVGRVGLEAELFPFWLAPGGRPAARLALVELIGVIDGIDGAARNPEAMDGRPSWQLDGALITEEPGAQVEVAGPPLPDADTALTELERVVDRLHEAFQRAGAGLAAAGLDCWSDDDDVPVQLQVPRYEAMTTYFNRRGGRQGHLLMCASCSLQINLDLGPPEVATRRWLLANLASPVLTAAFAASPLGDAVNGRAMGWRGLDPTRTGVAPPLIEGADDPLTHAHADAMRADVLLVERDGRVFAGQPGWAFGDWVRQPHHRFGRPTTADLSRHLTTLFPEARLRGFLEIRGVDELPRRWRAAAVALVTGLLYDESSTEAALAVLHPHRGQVPELLERAAHRGLGDPTVHQLSRAVLDIALAGAGRLAIAATDDAAAFLDRFTHRGQHPSDELREALDRGPASALAWTRA
jgi:glutamate--cysteine ligase